MRVDIYQVGLTELQKIDSGFTNNFFEEIINRHPEIGKICENYYIINNNIIINNNVNLPNIYKLYTIFVNMAMAKANLTQILKNQ